jgi:hypothetical protein
VSLVNRTERLINWIEEEKIDLDSNGIDDRLQPPEVDVAASAQELRVRIRNNSHSSPALAGGDIDATWEMAESSGEEAACGSAPTPDQNCVDELGEAMGIRYRDGETLNFGVKEHSRDLHRWELDPASSEDYLTRAPRYPRRPPAG